MTVVPLEPERYRLRQSVQQLPMIPAAAAVQADRKDRDYLQHILGQFLLKARLLAPVDYPHFDHPEFSQREHQFRAKAQQPVLVGEHRPLRPSLHYHLQQLEALVDAWDGLLLCPRPNRLPPVGSDAFGRRVCR